MGEPLEVRRRFRVDGTVQGVGFRPFVYRLATDLGLSGFVLNDAAGVIAEVQGAPGSVAAFGVALREHPPPLAVVEHVREEDIDPRVTTAFEIRSSDESGQPTAGVAPDVATCSACLEEVHCTRLRRHRYPFTNCTDCGPRFTITTAIPYDRPNTTMAGFSMCEECALEYNDPADRRFHAQPIACPACGPHLRLLDEEGKAVAEDVLGATADRLRGGAIVAIKGLGGYHLACDAGNESAVEELRRRKGREEKPFALMAPDVGWIERLAVVGPEEREALGSRRAPIVLLRRRSDAPVARSVAPSNGYLGIMLPYTPLHHLLLEQFGSPLVMTSGNLSEEPIAHEDGDALRRLGPIAEGFLMHDRPIRVRCDDSVVCVVDGRDYLVRRGRGYAPEPLTVAEEFTRPVLGAGPELKHTFCLGIGGRAIVSHHIGDLKSYEAMAAFVDGVAHLQRVFQVEPELVAHDLHPEYLSSKWAQELPIEKVGVQHHHAHIAACLADNGRTDKVLGLALDGTGWGEDGAVWGCELLVCDLQGFERVAHLRYVPMPGGDRAIREPWRMAAVYLERAFGRRAASMPVPVVVGSVDRWEPILQMARAGVNSPVTSSAGRLFDAVAALCGIRLEVSYEGQAAAELEQAADPAVATVYPCCVEDGEIDGVGLVGEAAADLARGRPVGAVAAGFHNGLAAALVDACEQAREKRGVAVVALSGGTWQNLFLLERVRARLEHAGFEVLVHRRVPPNDGGVSLGQAVVANAVSRVS
jgi:hydrogenase maturation protein HypF